MPILSVSGDISSPDYQCMRLVAQDLAKSDPTLTVQAHSLLEADWAVYLQAQTQGAGSARLEHAVSQPLATHSVEGYIGTLPMFLSWAHAAHKYSDKRDKKEYAAEAKVQFANYIKTSENHFCYFDMSIGGKAAPERVIFELFYTKCPKTVDNFRRLCTGEDKANSSGVKLNYANTPVHRIVSDAWIQGGDIVSGSGSGSVSVYGGTFADESFSAIAHDTAGVLSMANSGAHSNGSQFFITLKPLPSFDKKFVGFGRVIAGMATVRLIGEVDTKNQRPVAPVVIAACGIFTG